MESTERQSSAPEGRLRFLYYTLGLTPPVEHSRWVREDIRTRGWLLRRAAQNVVGVLLGLMLLDLMIEDAAPGLLFGAAIGSALGFLIQTTLLADYVRRRTLAYHERRWAEQAPSS